MKKVVPFLGYFFSVWEENQKQIFNLSLFLYVADDPMDWFHLEYRKLIDSIEKTLFFERDHLSTTNLNSSAGKASFSGFEIPSIIECLIQTTKRVLSECRGSQLKREFYSWWSQLLSKKCW